MCAVSSIKIAYFFSKLSKELISVVRFHKDQNSGYPKWYALCELMSILGVTKLRNVTKGENCDFSAFRFSLHLMLEQALSHLIVCLMI